MATVPEFISVAARMILTAISARLAAMTLLKKGTSQDAFTEVTQSGVETSGLLTLVETSSEIDTLNGLCLTEKDDLGAMRAAVDVAVNSSVNALVKSTILEMLNAEIVTFRKICSCYALLDRGSRSSGFAHAQHQKVPNFVAVVSQHCNLPIECATIRALEHHALPVCMYSENKRC